MRVYVNGLSIAFSTNFCINHSFGFKFSLKEIVHLLEIFLNILSLFFFFFWKILFNYLTGGGAEAEGEAGSPGSREPNAGLDPRPPGITT